MKIDPIETDGLMNKNIKDSNFIELQILLKKY